MKPPAASWLTQVLKRAAPLTCLALLGGCSSTPVATVEPFRTALRDVCIAREDVLTEDTAKQIEANNLALRRMLKRGSQCPKPRGKPPVEPTPQANSEPSTS